MQTPTPSYTSGALFMKAYRLLRQDVVECLNKYDLIPTTWAFLGIISQASNGIQLNEAATALSVKAPLVTNMADRLIDRGIIDRIPHPTDKRAKLLVVTPTGKKFIKTVEQDMQATLGNLLQGIDQHDLQTFQSVLETIISNTTA